MNVELNGPKAARDLIEAANLAGWRTDVEHNDEATFKYTYEDGSSTTFGDVPAFIVHITHGDVSMMAGWIKNPVTKRWVVSNAKPAIARAKREDEYPDGVTYRLNAALGFNFVWWEYWNVKALIELIEMGGAEEVAARIHEWTV